VHRWQISISDMIKHSGLSLYRKHKSGEFVYKQVVARVREVVRTAPACPPARPFYHTTSSKNMQNEKVALPFVTSVRSTPLLPTKMSLVNRCECSEGILRSPFLQGREAAHKRVSHGGDHGVAGVGLAQADKLCPATRALAFCFQHIF
jgi:hypothetical protein